MKNQDSKPIDPKDPPYYNDLQAAYNARRGQPQGAFPNDDLTRPSAPATTKANAATTLPLPSAGIQKPTTLTLSSVTVPFNQEEFDRKHGEAMMPKSGV